MPRRSAREWPDGTQDATLLGPDRRTHALPRWSTRDLHGVAHGFREAAEAVHDSIPERSPDPLFLPLAYLWRQHLELMLKANIQLWSRMLGQAVPKLGGRDGLGHELRDLWTRFVELSDAEIGDKDRADTVSAGKALETFLQLEPHPDSSRYAASVDGRRYARPERVDLRELHRAALAVSRLLTAAYDQADAWMDATQ